MNWNTVTTNISDELKQEIINSVEINNKQISTNNEGHKTALPFLFKTFNFLFPQSKQHISCSSCRKTVVNFFNKLCEHWNEKPKTRTGALSRA